ncbi:MAG: hypothetical protein LDLANPLL_00271 [Turneriella sp.]|nr:hypothetical protein [Turneriella sp.]
MHFSIFQKKKPTFIPENQGEILAKLLEKYRNAESKYGKKFFDKAKLDERIKFHQATKSDFERFILDEMEFFKSMEKKAVEEEARRRRQEEADARMREIMAENDARIAHYEDTFFHPLATLECRRIVSAISSLFPEAEEDLRYVFQGRKEWQEMKFHLADLERFLYKPPMRLTAFLAHYINDIQKWGEGGRDEADRKFLQTAAMCLTALSNGIATSVDYLSEKDKIIAKKIRTRLDTIVDDFRLTDLAQHGLKMKMQQAPKSNTHPI